MPPAIEELGIRISKNSLTFFFGTIIDKLFSLIGIVLVARYLGENEFGIFNYALIYTSLFAVLVDLGTESILIREISRNPAKSARLIGNSIILKIVLTLCTLIICFIVTFFSQFPDKKAVIIYLMLINLVFSPKLPTLKSPFEAIFKSRLKAGFPALINILGSFIFFVLVIVMIQTNSPLELIVLGYVFSGLPGLIFLYIKSKKIIAPEYSIDFGLLRSFLKESLPLALYALLIGLSNRMDVLMLSWMKSDAYVGLYSAAFRLTLPLSFIPVSLAVSILPVISKLYNDKDESLGKIYQFSLKIMICFVLPFALIIYTFSGNIINTLYTAQYASSVNALKILIISQVFLFLNVIMYHFIIAVGKQKRGLYVVGVMAVMNFVLNLFLIPLYGIEGASIATVITELSALILWICFTKDYFKSLRLSSYIKIIVLNVFTFLILKIIIPVSPLFSIIVFCIIQIFSLLLLKVITKEELYSFKTSI